jgi:hypothetical protein
VDVEVFVLVSVGVFVGVLVDAGVGVLVGVVVLQFACTRYSQFGSGVGGNGP